MGSGKHRAESKAKSPAEEAPAEAAADTHAVGDAAAPSAPVTTPGADEPEAPAVGAPPAAEANPYDSATFGGRQ